MRNRVMCIGMLLAIVVSSCEKQKQWLDVKRNKSDVVPTTLKDYQAILDNDLMNKYYSCLGLTGTDNLLLPDVNLNTVFAVEKQSYLWASDIWQSSSSQDYGSAYAAIGNINIVLDGLEKATFDGDDQQQYNTVKGQALFLRSMMFYQLAQLFCDPYERANAADKLGLQLRVNSDPAIKLPRSSVQQTYDQITGDLKKAITLLDDQQMYRTRATRTSAKALLAKVYLAMEDYPSALIYAGEVIEKNPVLLDYNSPMIDPQSSYRFPVYQKQGGNPEILFYSEGLLYLSLVTASWGAGQVDTTLYSLYATNDLRKTLFYQEISYGQIKYRGTYTGNDYLFCGIATNEMYLVLAECLIRTGNYSQGMVQLNHLLKNRFLAGTYKSLIAADQSEALKLVLNERRKELPFTAQLRWEDLRRLNKDPRFATTLSREVMGQHYELAPGALKYTFPIPPDEIRLSHIPQNPR